MNKLGMHILFYTRLLLYFMTLMIPFIYPVIVVPYDISGYAFWFFIIPAVIFFSFYFSPPLLKMRYWLIGACAGLFLAVIFIFGVIWDTLFHF